MIQNWTANAATEITVGPDFIGTSGESPGGFGLAALKRDLAPL